MTQLIEAPTPATQYFWFQPAGLTLAELAALAASLGFQGA